MLTLRCTQKLLQRMGGVSAEEPTPPTTLLGDWYAKTISLPFRGRSAVIFVNDPSRLTVIVPGRGTRKMLPVFQERKTDLLERLAFPRSCIEAEAQESREIQLARTDSRSVLGSMNDIADGIRAAVADASQFEAVDWDEIEMNMSERLHGPLDYERPHHVARRLCRERP